MASSAFRGYSSPRAVPLIKRGLDHSLAVYFKLLETKNPPKIAKLPSSMLNFVRTYISKNPPGRKHHNYMKRFNNSQELSALKIKKSLVDQANTLGQNGRVVEGPRLCESGPTG